MRWFLWILWKGPRGKVIFVEMDPFSFDNICSRGRRRPAQTTLATGGYREALWLMIELIVCQSAPDKLKCPQLFTLGCPMLLCSWVKMSRMHLETVTLRLTAKSESNSLPIGLVIKPLLEVPDSRGTKVFLVSCLTLQSLLAHVVFLHPKLSVRGYYLFIVN